jgi:DNA (cytosine-5)-methyltransferase 1
MTHGSLFSGIGGFDLAAEWMGWENTFHCELNPFGQQVLKYYWPDAKSYHDIKTTDFSIHRGTIDVLSGGFPCQPYSTAGKRKGTEDDRHLWPEMLRAIREVQPGYVVGENVRGLTNWNGGLVFDQVQADLEAEGYEVLPFLLPACSVGAPHERYRIWFVAYAAGNRNSGTSNEAGRTIEGQNGQQDQQPVIGRQVWNATNTSGQGLQIATCEQQRGIQESAESLPRRQFSGTHSAHAGWERFPTQSPIRGGDDGLPTELSGITFSDHCTASLMAYGNAVVPEVVYQIFKAIEQYRTQQ